MTEAPHAPVLLAEVIEALSPAPGDVMIDATFGAGGYTRRFLDAGASVHAFDRDPDAIAAGRADPARWPGLNLLGFALMQARAELSRAVWPPSRRAHSR